MAFSEQACWVEMNDGVKLDVSVCIPEGEVPEGGWPGLLFAHGHGDAGSKVSTLGQGRRFAERGYLTVCYSVRGQGCSEGLTFHMGPRELFDLQDMIDWALFEQPVHPEKLGVVGSSQGGWHAHMAAAHHPSVATVVPQNIVTRFDDFAVSNGCLTKWFFTRTMRRRILSAGFQELMRQWALSGDWDLIREWTRLSSPILFADRVMCPVFIVHGWHDVGMPPNEVVEMFERLECPKKLYLGGGGHDGQDDPAAQEVRQDLIDRWLDHWLKGEENGIMEEPAIVYTRRPGWEHAGVSAMPPEDGKTQTLYLRAGGKLLEEAPVGPNTHANVNNRPLDPDYTLRSAILDDMAGVPEGLAREVVSFEAEPVEKEVEILGAPRARFFMQPNRPELQVHAELFDVAPDGAETMITRGHFGTRTATPGRHVTVEIELRTIGYQLAAGHKLRLDVTNYNTTYVFPYFEPFYARLYHDGDHPSAVEIPVR
ncbi:MAG: CocE/NonD family hydrolase [bacterium]|nr:CocE/NonD family hydrolase [bacterium]